MLAGRAGNMLKDEVVLTFRLRAMGKDHLLV